MGKLWLAAVLAMGCSVQPQGGPPYQPPAPVVPRLPEIHFAAFVENELDECVDYAGSEQIATDGPGTVRIARPCGEQFAGKPVLATCSVRTSDGGGATFSYYRFRSVYEDQTYMRECLERQWQWSALPEDSDAFRRARIHARAAALQRMGESAQRMLDSLPTQ